MMFPTTPSILLFCSFLIILCQLVIVSRILFLELKLHVHVCQFVLNILISVLLVPRLGIYDILAALLLSYTPILLGKILSNVVGKAY